MIDPWWFTSEGRKKREKWCAVCRDTDPDRDHPRCTGKRKEKNLGRDLIFSCECPCAGSEKKQHLRQMEGEGSTA